MIILCEPQCRGFEHAAFNAALLVTAVYAFPGDEILFFGEQSHIHEIEKVLAATKAQPIGIRWRPIEIPAPRPGGLRRLPAERKLIDTIIAQTSSAPVECVLFCSATEITILALKQRLTGNTAPYNVRVVLHGVLRSLIEQRWRKPWRWGFSLRQALHLPHPATLKYITLSESIRIHAARILPSLSPQIETIDMPRLWNSNTLPSRCGATNTRFGFFGSTAKGFRDFYEIAHAVKSQNPIADFSLIGFLNGRDLHDNYREDIVHGLSRAPLSQEEYSRRAAAIDYAVWPANPSHYSLTASASFLDALDYLKPVIYLANPYIDHYFEKMGNIGYRCETLAQMQSVIEELAQVFPAELYDQQRATILEGRKIFEPPVIAPALKRILTEDAINTCAS